MKRGEQAFFLEPKRVQDLIVPEEVTARAGGLGDDQVRQANGLGALDVKLGKHPCATRFFVRVQERLRELSIES